MSLQDTSSLNNKKTIECRKVVRTRVYDAPGLFIWKAVRDMVERIVFKTKEKYRTCEKNLSKGEKLKNMKNAIKIKESLIKQLENKSAATDYFLALVDDYIFYYNEERGMQEDIKTRGRSYKTKSASGFPIIKENESLKNALIFNKQKLAILKQLGLTIDNVVGDAVEL